MKEDTLELKRSLNKIEVKIDKLTDQNGEQNVKLGKMEVMFEKQQTILDEHQRRSIASENRINLIEKHQSNIDKTFEKHLSFVKGSIWVVGALGATLSIIAAVVSYFK